MLINESAVAVCNATKFNSSNAANFITVVLIVIAAFHFTFINYY